MVANVKDFHMREEKRQAGDLSGYQDIRPTGASGRSRRAKKPFRITDFFSLFYQGTMGMMFLVFSLAVAGVLIVYLYGMISYTFKFYPGSTINGIDVSGMSASDARDAVQGAFDDYSLLVHLRECNLTFDGKSLGIDVKLEPNASYYLGRQDVMRWFLDLKGDHAYMSSVFASFEDVKAKDSITKAFEDVPRSDGVEPSIRLNEDGTLTYLSGQTKSDFDIAFGRAAILDAASRLEPELDLRDTEFYADPSMVGGDMDMMAFVDSWNACGMTDLDYGTFILSGKSVIANMQMTSEQTAQVSTGFLTSVLTSSMGVGMTPDLMEENTILIPEIRDAIYSYWLKYATKKLAKDIGAHSTNGKIPPISRDGKLTGVGLEIDVASHTARLYKGGKLDSEYAISLGGYTNWGTVRSGVYVPSYPSNKAISLSNGMIIRASVKDADIGIADMDNLIKAVKTDPLAYVMIIGPWSSREAAWKNQVGSESNVGKMNVAELPGWLDLDF